ncbi:hypothetical protein NGB36_21515 [Streptomyces sp. RB6PN25]|uniref:Uncharacterized protein n=1 Tax=Streptomyces humicola TaxID=2953240 RepID=A0ABT1PZL1_9ACTN|nr:hypothetical protein [Streptomyces humicola]MCQ4083114.1 hypothetical protein [Streptomyces humicola]
MGARASDNAHQLTLAPEDDFCRDEQGLIGLLDAAGLQSAACETLRWDHRASAAEWWGGPDAGAATIGQIVVSQTPEIRAGIKRHFDLLSGEFTGPDGPLVLPHAALPASACA